MIALKRKYFVSYHFSGTDKEGFGNIEMTVGGRMKHYYKNVAEFIEKDLKRKGIKNANVCLLNWKRI